MKKYGTKFLAVLMAVLMAFSCLTISGSAFTKEEAAEFIMDILSMSGAMEKFAQAVEYNAADEVMSNVYQDVTGRAQNYNIVKPINLASSYTQVLKDNLNFIAQDWNLTYRNYSGISWTVRTALMNINGEPCWVVVINAPRSEFVVESGFDTWLLCDGLGNVLFATNDDTAPSSNGWISKSSIGDHYYLLSYEDLNNLSLSETGNLSRHGDYFIITDFSGNVLVNPDGYPYAAIANKDSAAVNQDRPTTSGTATDSSGNVTNIDGDVDYSTNIDINGGTVTFPDGVIEELNSVIYDESTKTYYVDSRDYSTTYNQSFSFYQYHINYTSVTYIGQTEEYNKYYEVYYELPDGRDSADLTDEDLERLSLSFKDVVNYARSTDNVNQRVLYHFDGDVEDSSYWSYCTKFDWTAGASLTYMDEGVFNGSLYLDETEHDFTISLPGNDAAGDYTLQFRYYQSYTAAPQTDSYLYIGDEAVMSFNGASYFDMNGAAITATSIGAWNEVCIIRSANVLYYYINGVFYKSVADNAYHKPTIRFHFGADQQTYKKLDELRFTKAVVYTPGEDYTVSSVPFDSNLALILPDGERPMADEVLVLTPSENNLLTAKGLDDWTLESTLSNVKKGPNLSTSLPYKSAGVSLYSNPSYTTFTYGNEVTNVTVKGTSPAATSYSGATIRIMNGMYLPTWGWRDWWEDFTWDDGSVTDEYRAGSQYTLYTVGQSYTLSVVLADGTYSSVTFTPYKDGNYYYNYGLTNGKFDNEYIGSAIDFVYTNLRYDRSGDSYHSYGISIVPTTLSADIIYMELVEGTEPQFSLDWEAAVYPASQLEDSPVIAIRSNTPVTKWQFGGVRPSYPEYGMVYAMVESGRISSMQQYTGYAWESVDGRIWTGERWIPYYAYDVFLLKDLFDVVGVDPEKEYIYTESGFWTWLQSAWKGMISRLDAIVEGINALGDGKGDSSGDTSGDTSGDSSSTNTGTDLDKLPAVPDDETTAEDESWNIVDLFVIVKDGTWSLITGVVKTGFDGVSKMIVSFGSITDYFDMYTSNNPDGVQGMFNYEGADIWD